ncbi:hypothetical protein EDD85DRAFT_1029862 [Armillaria nabsnona]|nr:hypothetical protein EDD85DRAFT_1029862 [Armillaria nabsnona]
MTSKQRRAMINNIPPSLRPTGASSFDHTMPGSMSPLFQDEFCGTLPSTKDPSLWPFWALGPTGFDRRTLTKPKAVDSVMGTRISLSILRVTADWHGNADVLKNRLRLYIMVLHVNWFFSLFHEVSLANIRVSMSHPPLR